MTSPNAKSREESVAQGVDTFGVLNQHPQNVYPSSLPDSSSSSTTSPDLSVPQEHQHHHVHSDETVHDPPTFKVGVSVDKNKKCRRTMEDSHSFVYDFGGIRGQGYFAVFDGHAGKHAAEWCGEHFHEHLLEALRTSPTTPIPDLLNSTFHLVDTKLSELSASGNTHSGCTAVTAFLRLEDENGNAVGKAGGVGDNIEVREGKLKGDENGALRVAKEKGGGTEVSRAMQGLGGSSDAPFGGRGSGLTEIGQKDFDNDEEDIPMAGVGEGAELERVPGAAAEGSSNPPELTASPENESGEERTRKRDLFSQKIKKAFSSSPKANDRSVVAGTSQGNSPQTSAPVSGVSTPNIKVNGPAQVKPAAKRTLYTANVGDARAVLSRGGRAVRLTYDHKGSDAKEAKRITDAGGFVMNNRVNGVLAVTRSLGDSSMKEFVVGSPYTTETTLGAEDDFLIVACDGLWDVCQDQEAVDIIKSLKSPQEASRALLDHALQNFSSDNLSVLVVSLRPDV